MKESGIACEDEPTRFVDIQREALEDVLNAQGLNPNRMVEVRSQREVERKHKEHGHGDI